jgi:hypothetical protein
MVMTKARPPPLDDCFTAALQCKNPVAGWQALVAIGVRSASYSTLHDTLAGAAGEKLLRHPAVVSASDEELDSMFK